MESAFSFKKFRGKKIEDKSTMHMNIDKYSMSNSTSEHSKLSGIMPVQVIFYFNFRSHLYYFFFTKSTRKISRFSVLNFISHNS